MPEVIRDTDGKVIQRSRNLRGIREFVGKHLIKVVDISKIGTSEGKLCILFEDGYSFETNFASFQTLKETVRNWRNMYGAPLLINGISRGIVKVDNSFLGD